MGAPAWVETVSDLATPLIAAISAIYVYLEYKRAQRWKAADLAASLLEKLHTDQDLLLACQALDWGVGPLIIPDKYRSLFGAGTPSGASGVMEHDPNVLCLAVRPNLDPRTLHDPRGLVYRYCFIKLFDYFDNMYKLLAQQQVVENGIEEVEYWLEGVRDYKYAPASIKGTEVFQPALRSWGYGNVILLGQRLKVEPWIHLTTAQP
jgi:hypothetical protein